MVKVHRELIGSLPAGERTMLDTPFGFQANADDLTEKIGDYFRDSVGTDLGVASWRRRDEPAAVRERALARVGKSSWAFAGPGSPSYALRQWIDTPMPLSLADIVERGGTLVMGSAAAVTLGSHSLPVYEIYKVGEESRWLTGLDLLGALTGLQAAVIPHYDNREGGRHDTRFCYMGETRLLELEAMLPEDVGVLGVDEHTAVIIDLDVGRAEVRGNGTMTLRHRQTESIVRAGEHIAIDDMRSALRGRHGARSSTPSTTADARTDTDSPRPTAAPAPPSTTRPTPPSGCAPAWAPAARPARTARWPATTARCSPAAASSPGSSQLKTSERPRMEQNVPTTSPLYSHCVITRERSGLHQSQT